MAVLAQLPEKIRVAIIDGIPLYRDGVAHLISSIENFELIAEGDDSAAAIEIAKIQCPDIMLLDIGIRGGGIKALTAISSWASQIKTIILTTNEDEEQLATAFGAGARGFIRKDVIGNKLVDIIRNVHAGSTYASPEIASKFFQRELSNEQRNLDPNKILTNRELEILDLVAMAKTNKEIALSYGITEKTVKHYMTNILQKLQVRNRVEAALVAQKFKTERSK